MTNAYNGLQTEITGAGDIWLHVPAGTTGIRLEREGIEALKAELKKALEQSSPQIDPDLSDIIPQMRRRK